MDQKMNDRSDEAQKQLNDAIANSTTVSLLNEALRRSEVLLRDLQESQCKLVGQNNNRHRHHLKSKLLASEARKQTTMNKENENEEEKSVEYSEDSGLREDCRLEERLVPKLIDDDETFDQKKVLKKNEEEESLSRAIERENVLKVENKHLKECIEEKEKLLQNVQLVCANALKEMEGKFELRKQENDEECEAFMSRWTMIQLQTIHDSRLQQQNEAAMKRKREETSAPPPPAVVIEKNEPVNLVEKNIKKKQKHQEKVHKTDTNIKKTQTLRTSQFKGVTKHKNSGRWEAHMWMKGEAGAAGKQVYLGGWKREEDAANAWDIIALKCRPPKKNGKGVPQLNYSSAKYEHLATYLQETPLDILITTVRKQPEGFMSNEKLEKQNLLGKTTKGSAAAATGKKEVKGGEEEESMKLNALCLAAAELQ